MKGYHSTFFILLALLPFCISGQTTASKDIVNRFYITGGVSSTIDFYNNNINYQSGDRYLVSGPSTYCRWNAAFYYSRIKSKHFMFQTGLEYTSEKYYIVDIEPSVYVRYSSSGYYFNTTITMNTFSIPAYFNLLLCKQKLFMGLGASLDVIPSSFSGYVTQQGGANINVVNVSGTAAGVLTSYLDIGVAYKMGCFINIKNQLFTIEGKFKYGLLNSMAGSTDILHNSYFTLNIGYVLKK